MSITETATRSKKTTYTMRGNTCSSDPGERSRIHVRKKLYIEEVEDMNRKSFRDDLQTAKSI